METTIKELEMINQQLKELAGIYRTAISRSGISENEFWIWYSLVVMDGEFSQQDICATWTFSKQTVNTIINHMVQKGFTQLEVVSGTRNKKLIRLTEAGRKYGESIVLPIVTAEQRAFGNLSEADRTAFSRSLESYIALIRGELNEI